MKKMLFGLGVITLLLAGCSDSNSDTTETPDNVNVDTSQIIGKWKIYKATYKNPVETITYSTTGDCTPEALEFLENGEVTEKKYIDANCTNGGTAYYTWWATDEGQFMIGNINSFQHPITITGDELLVDAWEEGGYRKYYKR